MYIICLQQKKTKRSIGATYQEPKKVTIKGNRIPADPISIAEINAELRKSAMIRKAIMCEAKILAKKMYLCGINNQKQQESVLTKKLKIK